MAKPNATASAMQTVPGMKNGWSTTYLPKRVEPVSSISTAASRVGYVGRTKSADTAAKLVKLRKSETIRTLYDHYACIRNIHTDLNNRC